MQSTVYWKSDEEILKELGERLKRTRIRAKLTQEQLAQNSGVGKSTIERAERGEGLQLLNLVKLFRALNMLPSLMMLLPSAELSPMEELAVRDSGHIPQRVRPKANSSVEYRIDHSFVWGEDK
ncbi:MAG: transcriptional regulator [Treponema sp.]|nr:transcriptional regulator [Treponema sp.]